MSNSFLEHRLSHYTQNQFPAFMREEGEQIIKFIEKYYEWLEVEGEVGHIKRTLSDYQDIDKSPAQFFGFLRNEFMVNIPKRLKTDERTLLKNIQDFYKSKGAEKSFQLLFRILYDEEIEFYIPGNDILKASDGRWFVERYIRYRLATNFDKTQIVGKQLVGQTSKAKARIERFESYVINGIEELRLFISNKINNFQVGEDLFMENEYFAQLVEYTENPGRYVSSKGHLSSDKFLQDNVFYQEYSYVIKSVQDAKITRPILKNLVHPAGTRFFNQFSSVSEIGGVFGDLQNLDEDLIELQLEVQTPIVQAFNLLIGAITSFIESELGNPMLSPSEGSDYYYTRTNNTLRFTSNTTNQTFTLNSGNTNHLRLVIFPGQTLQAFNPANNTFYGEHRVATVANSTVFTVTPNITANVANTTIAFEHPKATYVSNTTIVTLIEDTFSLNSNFTFGDFALVTLGEAASRTILYTNASAATMASEFFTFTSSGHIPNEIMIVASEDSNEIIGRTTFLSYANNLIRLPTPPAEVGVIVNDKYSILAPNRVTTFIP